MKHLILPLIFVLVLSACSAKPSEDDPHDYPTDTLSQDLVAFPMSTSMDIVMVGDALLHGNVYNDAKVGNTYDFTKQYTLMKDYIEPYDLAFYNQESMLGGTEIGLSSYPRFNSPYEFGDEMIELGFNLVSLANNHSYDRGVQAIENTVEYWNSKPVVSAGVYTNQEDRDAVHVYEKNGISYGFLAYTYYLNFLKLPTDKQFLVPTLDQAGERDRMIRDITALRPLVDVLIVSIHTDVEYIIKPSAFQVEIANLCAELGVDLVIQNHAHSIMPMERIGKTFVFYALGNFVSGQIGDPQKIGLIAALDIRKEVWGNDVYISIENPRIDLHYTFNQYYYAGNTKVIPFDELSTSILPDKAYYEDFYLKVINSRGLNLTWGGVKKTAN